MSTAHFDLDCVKYAVSSVGEKREVRVIHRSSGREIIVPTRTDWYGHWKKKEGGKLAEINKGRDSPFTWDEFDYEDIQTQKEPIANVLHSAKMKVEGAIKASGARDCKFYIGSGESFRVERSTLLEYKGNRKDQLKPLLIDEVTEYLSRKYKAEVVKGYEVDDVVVMNSYGKSDHFIIGEDKDFYGTGSNFFNLNKQEEGIVDTRGFGSLWLDEGGKVRGKGMIFKLLQACSEDNSDNYSANCYSKVRWGEKSAFNALSKAKNPAEAFKIAKDIFKKLYPEKEKVIGWRGDEIEIDWLYVFQECLDMCHLHRWEGDFIPLEEVLNKLNISIGD